MLTLVRYYDLTNKDSIKISKYVKDLCIYFKDMKSESTNLF